MRACVRACVCNSISDAVVIKLRNTEAICMQVPDDEWETFSGEPVLKTAVTREFKPQHSVAVWAVVK